MSYPRRQDGSDLTMGVNNDRETGHGRDRRPRYRQVVGLLLEAGRVDPVGHPFDLCLKADDPRTTLMGVTLDCPDATELSAFYAQLLGKPVTYDADGMAMIGSDGDHPVLFQQVANYTPPQWPDPARPQQFHLDVMVDDLDAGEEAARSIGATRLAGGGKTFRVFADPASKPFCLTTGD